MPQISLYIDKVTLAKIEKAAAKERTSISKWVGKKIKKAIGEEYPKGFFDLFGSLTNTSFESKKLSFDLDSKRETL